MMVLYVVQTKSWSIVGPGRTQVAKTKLMQTNIKTSQMLKWKQVRCLFGSRSASRRTNDVAVRIAHLHIIYISEVEPPRGRRNNTHIIAARITLKIAGEHRLRPHIQQKNKFSEFLFQLTSYGVSTFLPRGKKRLLHGLHISTSEAFSSRVFKIFMTCWGTPVMWYDQIIPRNTNMTMEKQLFEDVYPLKNDDFPLPC